MYEKSARIYDLLYVGSGIKDYPAEAEELHRIIHDQCPTAHNLLDVACGTGARLVELKRWYSVEGVDVSRDMLAVAQSRLPGVPLQLADMRTLDLGKTFDAVTCLFSSIGYITEPAEIRSTITRLAEHVAPGGVLILDGWIRPDRWRDHYRPEPEVVTGGDVSVVRLSSNRPEGRITELDMHHLVQTDDYVSAVSDAGLNARVIPDYMPNRDRIVGTRPR